MSSAYTQLLATASQSAAELLHTFASRESFISDLSSVFGSRLDANQADQLRDQWSTGDFSNLPTIEVRPAAELNGALGAYATATDTIYISDALVQQGDQDALVAVLLEEIGHGVDARLNATDTPGDEGHLFSAAVRGEHLTAQQVELIVAEDDTAQLLIDGQLVDVEMKLIKVTSELPGNGKSLREAIEEAIADAKAGGPQDYVIDLRSISENEGAGWDKDLDLGSSLPAIDVPITIHFIGDGDVWIDGQDQHQIITIGDDDGNNDNITVTFEGVNFKRGYARGGDGEDGAGGSGGGGGGLGAGGAVFIHEGTVVFRDVQFDGNTARGGNGGDGGSRSTELYNNPTDYLDGGDGGGLNAGSFVGTGADGATNHSSTERGSAEDPGYNGGDGDDGKFGQGGGGATRGENQPNITTDLAGHGGNGGAGGWGAGGGGGGGGGGDADGNDDGEEGSGGTGGDSGGDAGKDNARDVGADGTPGTSGSGGLSRSGLGGNGGGGAGLGGAVFARKEAEVVFWGSGFSNNNTIAGRGGSTGTAASSGDAAGDDFLFQQKDNNYRYWDSAGSNFSRYKSANADTSESTSALSGIDISVTGDTIYEEIDPDGNQKNAAYIQATGSSLPAEVTVYYYITSNPEMDNGDGFASSEVSSVVLNSSNGYKVPIIADNDDYFESGLEDGHEAKDFTIHLLTGPYDRNTPSKTITIVDDEPIVSITKVSDALESEPVEGEAEYNRHGEFQVTLDRTTPQTFDLYFTIESLTKSASGTYAQHGSLADPAKDSDYKVYYYEHTGDKASDYEFRRYIDPADAQSGQFKIEIQGKTNPDIRVGIETINDEIFDPGESITVTLKPSREGNNKYYGIDSANSKSTVLINDDEPIVSVGKIVNPTEGFSYGSTLAGLGQSVELKNGNQITVPASPSLDLSQSNAFTQELWVSVKDLGDADYNLLSFGNGGPTLTLTAEGLVQASFTSDGALIQTKSLRPIALEAWTHIAASFDGEVFHLYVNGQQVMSEKADGFPVPAGGNIRIGDSSNSGFVGLIDEVRIWNLERTQAQLQHSLLTPLAGDETGLVGNWQFEGNFQDSSTSENHGGMYRLSQSSTWEKAQAEAEALGGNLVTINDAAEQQRLIDTFGDTEDFWIGLTDKDSEGNFKWISGEALDYQNWHSGQPNNFGVGQDYVEMNYLQPGQWNDEYSTASQRGIIELKGTFLENPAPQISYIELNLTDGDGNPYEVTKQQGLWVRYNIKDSSTATQQADPEASTNRFDFDYYNSQFQITTTDNATRFDGVVVPQGESTARIYFGAVSDAIDEGDETIDIEIIPYNVDAVPGSPDAPESKELVNSQYGLKDSSGNINNEKLDASVTIIDNPRYQAGFVLLDANNRAITADNPLIPNADGTATVKIRPTSQPEGIVEIGVNGSSFAFNADNWDVGQTVNLSNLTGNGITLNISPTSVSPDSTYRSLLSGGLPSTVFLGDPSDDKLYVAEDPVVNNQDPVIPEVSLVALEPAAESNVVPGILTVRLSDSAPEGGLKVYYDITGGTATVGEDYLAPTDRFIVVPEGETTASVNISLRDDNRQEGTETLSVSLRPDSSTTPSYVLTTDQAQQQAVLEIRDDETAGIDLAAVSYKREFQQFDSDATNPLAAITAVGSIAFADLDRDGDIDAFVVDANGQVQFYENVDLTDQRNQPQFQQNTTSNPIQGIDLPVGSRLIFIDIDKDAKGFIQDENGDTIGVAGDLDLVVVQPDGTARLYKNIDDSLLKNQPKFVEETADNPFAGLDLGAGAKLTFADLDTDDDLDLFAVQPDGTVRYFENTIGDTEAITTATYVAQPDKNPFKDVQLEPGSNLAFADLDIDGDFDAYSVAADGSVTHFRNTGDLDVPELEQTDLNDPFANTPVTETDLQFVDLDNDLDLDVVVRDDNGALTYHQNETVLEPIFTPGLNQLITTEDGRSQGFGVRLSSQPTENVTLKIHRVDNSEVTFDQTTFTFTPDNWDQHQLITVTGVDDGKIDGDVTFNLTLQTSGADPIYRRGVVELLPITNLEETVPVAKDIPERDTTDLPTASLNIITPTLTEGGTQGQVEVTLSEAVTFDIKALSELSDGRVTVQLTNAAAGQRYSLIPGSRLRFGETELEVVSSGSLTAEGTELQVKLVQGSTLTANDLGTALPIVKVDVSPIISNETTAEAGYHYDFGKTPIFEATDLPGLSGFGYHRYDLVDIDGDGDLDAFYGNANNDDIGFLENVGTASEPSFKRNYRDNPFYDINSQRPFTVNNTYGSPNFFDIDGDGDQDAVIGYRSGPTYYAARFGWGYTPEPIKFYRNDGNATNPKFVQARNPFADLNIGSSRATPTFVDLDLDGDDDLVVGVGNQLKYFENSDGRFTEASNPFSDIQGLSVPAPQFADLDQDGDQDLILKGRSNDSLLRYFENVGGASPRFVEAAEYDNPLAWISRPDIVPTFGDLNNDGTDDLFLGSLNGDIHYQFSQLDRSANSLGIGEIAPGETSTVINIDPLENDTFDGDRVLNLSVKPGETYTIKADDSNQGTVTIADNDQPGIVIRNASGGEITPENFDTFISEGATPRTFTIELSSQPKDLVTLEIGTTNGREGLVKLGEADAASDVVNAVQLKFTDTTWNQPQTFSVVPQDDAIADGLRPFKIVSSATSPDRDYDALKRVELNFTTRDNDETGLLIDSQPGDRVNIIEGVTDAYTISLKSQPTENTTRVRVLTSSLNEQIELNGVRAGNAIAFDFTEKNWNQPRTVRVNAVDDNVVEGTQITKLDIDVERTLQFDNFSRIEELELLGNAQPGQRSGDTILQLTSGSGHTGGVFTKDQAVSLKRGDSFSSFFRFTVDDPGAIAQGLAFVIAAQPELGSGDTSLGYGGLANSVAVELDLANSGAGDGGSDNHVAISVNGSPTNLKAIRPLPNTQDLNDGGVWNVWVDYNGSTDELEVRVADSLVRPDTATVSYQGVKDAIGQDAAYLGLTGANSTSDSSSDGSPSTQSILTWEITGNDPAYNEVDFINSGTTKSLDTPPLTVEIQDNDLPEVSLIAGPKALEVADPSYFTIQLNNVAESDPGSAGINVNYRITGGSAKNDIDYQPIQREGSIRVAPGDIQNNLLVFPIDDFATESTEFEITEFDATTGTLGLKVSDSFRLYEGTTLAFGKEGSDEGSVARVILDNTAKTDPATGLRYVNLIDNANTSVLLEVLEGNSVEADATSGVKAGPIKVSTASDLGASGLKAEYFDHVDIYQPTPQLSNYKFTRIDPNINFDWGSGSPDSQIDSDTFGVRWTGFVQAPEDGDYTFILRHNNGARLTIDGQNLINSFDNSNGQDNITKAHTDESSPISLKKGEWYPITVEYFENEFTADVNLSWKAEGGNAETGVFQIPQGIIPTENFSPFLPDKDVQLANLQIGDFTLAPGSTLKLPDGTEAIVNEEVIINSSGQQVQIALEDGVDVSGIEAGLKAKVESETITVEILPGDGYTINAEDAVVTDVQKFQVTSYNSDTNALGLKLDISDKVGALNGSVEFSDGHTRPIETSSASIYWSSLLPDAQFAKDGYTATLSGFIYAPTTGDYTFSGVADDYGASFRVDGQDVDVRDWNSGGSYQPTVISLEAGQWYPIELSYTDFDSFEYDSNGNLKYDPNSFEPIGSGDPNDYMSLSWQIPGASRSSTIPSKYLSTSNSEVIEFTLKNGDTLTLPDGNEVAIGETVTVDFSTKQVFVTTDNEAAIQVGQTAEFEVKTLSSTLEILDNDLPGVRVVTVGDRATTNENETTEFAISLLSEPQSPVTIELFHDGDQLKILNLSEQLFEATIKDLSANKTTGTLDIQLFEQPTDNVVVGIPLDGAADLKKYLTFTPENWQDTQSLDNVVLDPNRKVVYDITVEQVNADGTTTPIYLAFEDLKDTDTHKFIKIGEQLLSAGLDSSKDLTLTLAEKPSEPITLRITDASGNTTDKVFTDANWDDVQTVSNVEFTQREIYDTAITVRTNSGSTFTNDTLRFEKVAANDFQLIPAEQGQESFNRLTFDATDWYVLKPVLIEGVDDAVIEDTIHDSVIQYSIVTADPNYAPVTIADQSVDIVDRILDAEEVKRGFTGDAPGVSDQDIDNLDELPSVGVFDSFDDMFDNLELPFIGSVGKSGLIDVGGQSIFAEANKAVFDSLSKLNISTAEGIEAAIEDALADTIFGETNVTVTMTEDEVSFAFDLAYSKDLFSIDLAADLGMPGLGLKTDGEVEATVDLSIGLAAGLHKDFGFYIDTAQTGVFAGISLGLSDDFEATGNFGFIAADITNNDSGLGVELTATLEDLDNGGAFFGDGGTIKFFDIDGDGQLDADAPFLAPVQIDNNGDGKPDVDSENNPLIEYTYVQEGHSFLDKRGQESDPPNFPTPDEQTDNTSDSSGDEATPEPQFITVTKEVLDQEAKYEKNAGIYRLTDDGKFYYLDSNRNGKLDINSKVFNNKPTQDWSELDENAKKYSELYVLASDQDSGEFTFRTKKEDPTTYYFDSNKNGKLATQEIIPDKLKTRFGNKTALKADVDTPAQFKEVIETIEVTPTAPPAPTPSPAPASQTVFLPDGDFKTGIGVKFLDINENGVLDYYDTGDGLALEPYVNSGFDPITVNDDKIVSFLDLDNSGDQGDGVIENTTIGRTEPVVRQYFDSKSPDDGFYYIDLDGDSEYDAADENDPDINVEPTLSQDSFGFYTTAPLKPNNEGEYEADFSQSIIVNFGAPYLTFLDSDKDDKQTILLYKNLDSDKEIEDLTVADGEAHSNVLIQEHENPNGSTHLYLDINGDGAYNFENKVLERNGNDYLDFNDNGKIDSNDFKIKEVSTIGEVKDGEDVIGGFFVENGTQKALLLQNNRFYEDRNNNDRVDGGDYLVIATGGEVANWTIKGTGNNRYLDETGDGELTREDVVIQDDDGFIVDTNGNGKFDEGEALVVYLDPIIREGNVLSDPDQYLDYNNDGQYTQDFDVSYSESSSDKVINFLDLDINGQFNTGTDIPVRIETEKDENGDDIIKSRHYDDPNGSSKQIVDLISFLDLDDDSEFNGDEDIAESLILINEEGIRFLDLNGDGDQSPGEPFSEDAAEPLQVDDAQIVSYTISQDSNGRFIDYDGDGFRDTAIKNEEETKNTPEDIGPDDALTKQFGDDSEATIENLLNISDFEISVDVLDIDGNGRYTLNEPRVLTIDGVRFLDLDGDGELDIDDDEDLNSDGKISFSERNLDVEPSSTPNNDFSALEVQTRPKDVERDLEEVEYFDLNGSGDYETDEDFLVKGKDANGNDVDYSSKETVEFLDDGDRLTLAELAVFGKDPNRNFNDLFKYEFSGAGQIDLDLKGGVGLSTDGASTAFPSINANLQMNLPLFNLNNEEDAEEEEFELKLNDVELDLGSFMSDFISPVFTTANDIIEPIKPILSFLKKDLGIPAKLGMDGLFEKDGEPGTTILEVAETVADLTASKSGNAKAQKYAKKIQTAVKVVKAIDGVATVVEALNDFSEEAGPDDSILISLGDYDLSGLNAGSKDKENSTSKTNVAGDDSQLATTKEAEALPSGQTSSTGDQTTDSKKKKTGGLVDKFKSLEGFDIPILTNPITGIQLLLGQSAVDLVTYDIPDLDLEFGFEVSQKFIPFPAIEMGFGGSFNVKSDLFVGFDTFGAEKVIEEDAPWYEIFDGFYIRDAEDGNDTPELSLGAEVYLKGALDAEVLEASVRGGIQGEANLDLVDKGEAQGVSDGKLRFSEAFDIIDDEGFLGLISLAGSVDAFFDVSVVETVFDTTLFYQELARVTLFEFELGPSGASAGGRLTQSYISGGLVYFDANFSGTLDADEPFTFTNADGSYNFSTSLDAFDLNSNGTLDVSEGRIVGTGGIDTTSGIQLENAFYAIPGSLVVSPVTTLQAVYAKHLADNGADSATAASDAEAKLKLVLGLPDIDLATFDVILEIEENLNVEGVEIYKAHVAIQSLLLTSINILENATTEPGQISNAMDVATEVITEALTNANSFVDLSDPTQLGATVFATLAAKAQVLAGTGLVEGFDDLIDVATTISAKNNASINQLFAETDIETLLEDVGGKKYELQILPADTIGTLFAEAAVLFIEDQLALEDGSFQSTAPVLENMEGEVTYSATVADGSPLPEWLSLDTSTGVLSGTPTNQEVGTLDVILTATDSVGTTTSDTLSLIIKNTNDAPVVASAILDQVAIDSDDFSFTVPDHVFSDVDAKDALTYTATLADDSPLPTWLSFDAETLTFSGMPDEAVTEPFNIKVTATDSDGTSVSDIFTFVVGGLVYFDANFNGAFDDGELYAYEQTDGSYEFNAPIDTFDLDGSGTLDLDEGRIVKLGELDETTGITLGSPLYAPPGSEVVNPLTTLQTTRLRQLIDNEGIDESEAIAQAESELEQVFGLPDVDFTTFDAVEEIETHRNPVGKQVYQSHLLTESLLLTGISILENATVEPGQLNDPTALALEAIAQGLADAESVIDFTDPDQLKATVFAVLADTAKASAGDGLIPNFDDLISNAAAIAAKNSQYILQLFADADLNSVLDDVAANSEVLRQRASDVFRSLLAGTPILVTESQKAAEDSAFQSTSPVLVNVPNATYTATLDDGSPLPAWLQLNSETGIFSGTPSNDDVGTLGISLRASDEVGTSIDASLKLVIENVNDIPVLAKSVPNQSAFTNERFEFTLPPDTFVDDDAGDVLTYTAQLSNGRPLPAWLSFDAATNTFQGNPSTDRLGELEILVTATDGSSTSASDRFLLIVSNSAEDIPDDPILPPSTDGSSPNTQITVDETPNTTPVPPPAPITGLSLKGSRKKDRLVGSLDNDRLIGGAGNDVLLGLDGDDRLIGGKGRDRLKGGAGDDLMKGNNGNDKLIGNAGDDILIGGKGDDNLKGGSGEDTFVLHKAHGRNRIRDFQDGDDLLKLSGKLSFGDLDITQKGKKTLISYEDEQLAVLFGVQADQIAVADFS